MLKYLLLEPLPAFLSILNTRSNKGFTVKTKHCSYSKIFKKAKHLIDLYES